MHPCALVSAMQDRARLDVALMDSTDEVPNLLFSWLWFRRYILSYPERCEKTEASCHHYFQQKKSAWTVTEKEYPLLLRELPPTHALIKEFEDQIDWFRDLVLNSPDLELKRWDGPLRGELGLKTRTSCDYARLRITLPCFVVEVPETTWDLLETQGYTSLLEDRGHHFILFGPLSLVMDGKDDVWFGAVQGRFDWGSCVGSTIVGTTEPSEMVRLVRLGTLPRVGETGRKPRMSYKAGDEIVVRYADGSGCSRRGSGSRDHPVFLTKDAEKSLDQSSSAPAMAETPAEPPANKSDKRKRAVGAAGTTRDETVAKIARVRRKTRPTEARAKLQKLSTLARGQTADATLVDLATDSCEGSMGWEEDDE